jgi:hypothetical protein
MSLLSQCICNSQVHCSWQWCVIDHCGVLYLTCPLSVDRQIGCFLPFAITNKVAVVSHCTCHFAHGLGIAGSRAFCMLNDIVRLLSIETTGFHSHQQGMKRAWTHGVDNG